MRNKICIISHNFHTFLLNEIEYASAIYDKVVVITLYEKQLADKFSSYKNVDLVFFSKKDIRISSCKGMISANWIEVFNEISDAIQQGVLSKLYWKTLLFYMGLRYYVRAYLKKSNMIVDPNEWIFLSAWYSAPAFVVADIKKKYKGVSAVSLAHSFEIDKRKTKFTDVLFRKNYSSCIDLTSFISRNVLDEFLNEHKDKLNLDDKKFEVRYLGTKKVLEGLNNKALDNNKIVVVSCSNVIPEKRVKLLFDSLMMEEAYNVEWYHIGTGVLFKELKDLVNNIKKENISVHLMGRLDNNAVHEFLLNTPIDVFVNVSSSEGIPVTIMEAIAYGIPVVATDVGGNSEIIDESCGVIISENPDSQEILRAIEKIKQSVEYDAFASNAYEKFLKLFDSDSSRPDFYNMMKNTL